MTSFLKKINLKKKGGGTIKEMKMERDTKEVGEGEGHQPGHQSGQ
jgi:hypothetical protein